MWERDKNNVKGDEVYHFNKFPPLSAPFLFPSYVSYGFQ
jgi:hypothetical protein